NRLGPDEVASIVADEWADAANRETRRVMGARIGEPLPAYWPPYSAVAVERALAEARALPDVRRGLCLSSSACRRATRGGGDMSRQQGRPAESTVEALVLGLRERGTAALAEGPVRQRLVQLDEEQVVKVGDRLQALRPHIAKAWAPEEVQRLLEAW